MLEITLNQNQAGNMTSYSDFKIYKDLKCPIQSLFFLFDLNRFSRSVLLSALVEQCSFFFTTWPVWQDFIRDLWRYTRRERTEGEEDGWRDARQRTGGDGGSGRIPSSPGCVWVTSQEMLQPRREGSSTWVTLTSPAGAGFCGVQITHF